RLSTRYYRTTASFDSGDGSVLTTCCRCWHVLQHVVVLLRVGKESRGRISQRFSFENSAFAPDIMSSIVEKTLQVSLDTWRRSVSPKRPRATGFHSHQTATTPVTGFGFGDLVVYHVQTAWTRNQGEYVTTCTTTTRVKVNVIFQHNSASATPPAKPLAVFRNPRTHTELLSCGSATTPFLPESSILFGSHAADDHNNPSSPPRTLGPARGEHAYTTPTTLLVVLVADRAAETGRGSLAAT
ncbi:unnamed protein product, partial [Ectocarpus sp. 6 AP-2014]